MRLSYKMPYAGNHLTLRNVSPYSTERLIIAAPPTVQISGSGISPAGQDQGFNVYMRDNVAANSPIDVSVSGTAPPPQASSNGAAGAGGGADNSQNPSVNSRASDGGAEAQSVSATTIPARLDGLKWILTGGFASIFVLGFAYFWLKPRTSRRVEWFGRNRRRRAQASQRQKISSAFQLCSGNCRTARFLRRPRASIRISRGD